MLDKTQMTSVIKILSDLREATWSLNRLYLRSCLCLALSNFGALFKFWPNNEEKETGGKWV